MMTSHFEHSRRFFDQLSNQMAHLHSNSPIISWEFPRSDDIAKILENINTSERLDSISNQKKAEEFAQRVRYFGLRFQALNLDFLKDLRNLSIQYQAGNSNRRREWHHISKICTEIRRILHLKVLHCFFVSSNSFPEEWLFTD